MHMALDPLLTNMLPCPIGLHLQNTSPKIKPLRNPRWQQQSIKPSIGLFGVRGPVQLHRWHIREADHAWGTYYCATRKLSSDVLKCKDLHYND